MQTFWHEVKLGAKMLAKAPLFTAVVIVTLAVGVGTNTTIFSAVYGILLSPLPFPDASRLVTVTGFERFSGTRGVGIVAFNPYTWQLIESRCPQFEGIATYARGDFVFIGNGHPEKVNGTWVSGDFFSVIGVHPLLGRPILPDDAQPGSDQVVVLSYGLWQSLLGGDQTAVGREINLNEKSYTIIGIMPRGGMFPHSEPGLWVPLVEQQGVSAIARVKKGWTVEEANSQLKTLTPWLRSLFPKRNPNWELAATSVREELVGDVRKGLLFLQAAAGLVLLIACINVSGLLLARIWSRQMEVSIRQALGATRGRIVGQFLAESLLLALGGGALGILVSVWCIRVLRVIAPTGTPRIEELRLDLNVLGFAAIVSIIVGFFVGLAPALQITRNWTDIRLNTSSSLSEKRPYRLRSVLAVGEIVLAVVLVVGATLLGRSYYNLMNVSLGFRPDHLLTMTVNFSRATCDRENLYSCRLAIRETLEGIRSLSGTESAAATSDVPLDGAALVMDLDVEGRSEPGGLEHGMEIAYRYVSPQYFSVLGISLLRGRDFDTGDTLESAPVAIINEEFARKVFAGNPLGRRVSWSRDKNGQPQWITIVGEVSNSRDLDLRLQPIPELYIPFEQSGEVPETNLVVRTTMNASMIDTAVRQQVAAIDKTATVTKLRTMDEVIAQRTAGARFRTLLLGAFGLSGLILAIVGIYSVLSYLVHMRTREIGVRMALGARPMDILRMVISQGVILAGTGIVVGIAGALAFGRILRRWLFEISATNPLTVIGVAVCVMIVAVLACYVPARRAMRVDPASVLRYE